MKPKVPILKILFVLINLLMYGYAFSQEGKITISSDTTDSPTIEISADIKGINMKVENVRVYEGGTCSQFEIEGVEQNVTVDLDIDVTKGLKTFEKMIVDGITSDIRDVVSPTIGCNAHIFNVSGYLEAYVVNAHRYDILQKKISGGVNFNDIIEVYSPIETQIELPIHVSASVVAIQTFCNPEKSRAYAKAELTGEIAGQTINVGGDVEVIGALLDNKALDESKTISIDVKQGVNTFILRVNGTLYAESTAQGISKMGVIACGSNAVASAGNSVTLGFFTGPNGTNLPEGMSIYGLETGINYVNPEIEINCEDFPIPTINTFDASCGLNNGGANILLDGKDLLNIEWSNGSTDTLANELSSGEHYVIISDSNSCSKIFTFNINDNTIPDIVLPKDTLLHEGDSIWINVADTSNQNFTYAWNTGSDSSAILVSEPEIYSVIITDTVMNCTFEYEIKVISSIEYLISDGDIVTNSGVFYDDGGANSNYSDDESYVVTICPKNEEEFIVLDFTDVSLYPSSRQDELSVFDGKGSICILEPDVTQPSTFIASRTSEGCLTVRFRATSYDGTRAGWSANISTTTNPPDGCITILNKADSIFTDSGDTIGNYSSNEFYVYNICPQNSDSGYVTLDFQEVDIHYNDNLAIYDGLGVDCLLEPSLEAPQIFTASSESGGCLTAIFNSDTYTTKQGWKAVISETTTPVYPPEYCNCGINPEPANTCENAPLLNNLEAFCGFSSIQYTADAPGDLEAEFDCGIAHNNSFLRFVPNNDTVEIGFQTTGGTNVLCEGFQLAVFSVEEPCCSDNSDWEQVMCMNISDGINSDGVFTVPNLIPGNEYYLMIDGSYGSECYYTLEAESGFELCPLDLNYESIICNSDGSYSVSIPYIGIGDSTTYKVYEKNNYYNAIDTIVFFDSGLNDTVTIGNYPAGWDYNIIINGGNDLSNCYFEIEGSSNCKVPCEQMQIDYSVNCKTNSSEYSLTGSIEGGSLPLSVVNEFSSNVIYPNNEKSFEIGSFTNESQGYYLIHLNDFTGCYQLDSIEIKKDFLPVIDIENNIQANIGDTIELSIQETDRFSYLWSTGDTTNTIEVFEAGNYVLEVSNEFGCTAIDTIYVDFVTNIEENNNADCFKIFPNPGNDKIIIILTEVLSSDFIVSITDISGKIVFENKYKSSHDSEIEINMQPFSKGIYLVNIQTNTSKHVRSWIKQ